MYARQPANQPAGWPAGQCALPIRASWMLPADPGLLHPLGCCCCIGNLVLETAALRRHAAIRTTAPVRPPPLLGCAAGTFITAPHRTPPPLQCTAGSLLRLCNGAGRCLVTVPLRTLPPLQWALIARPPTLPPLPCAAGSPLRQWPPWQGPPTRHTAACRSPPPACAGGWLRAGPRAWRWRHGRR